MQMKIRYDDAGHGEPVVLVHGLGASANIFGAQLAALQSDFRVLVPDLMRQWRDNGIAISIDTLVGDVIELIDEVGIETAHFVGHSLGSVVVQHLAVRHRSRVKSVALIGPIQVPADAGKQALLGRAARARSSGMTEVADTTVLSGTAKETRHDRPEIAAFVRELVMRQDPESYAQTCEAIVALSPAPIETLRCPTLVVTGDQDATSPPAVAKAIAQKIPAATYVELPACGHWTPIEKAREISGLLREFLLRIAD
ncbi:hypothetical protein WS68_23900 [Burkholderia sp. TSV86]|nr:hypothetical protein WS68_23900 [Burkholderia sp. TSV86]